MNLSWINVLYFDASQAKALLGFWDSVTPADGTDFIHLEAAECD